MILRDRVGRLIQEITSDYAKSWAIGAWFVALFALVGYAAQAWWGLAFSNAFVVSLVVGISAVVVRSLLDNRHLSPAPEIRTPLSGTAGVKESNSVVPIGVEDTGARESSGPTKGVERRNQLRIHRAAVDTLEEYKGAILDFLIELERDPYEPGRKVLYDAGGRRIEMTGIEDICIGYDLKPSVSILNSGFVEIYVWEIDHKSAFEKSAQRSDRVNALQSFLPLHNFR